MYTFQAQLWGAIAGWKTRKIFSSIKIQKFISSLQDTEKKYYYLSQQEQRLFYSDYMKEKKFLKLSFLKQFYYYFYTGRWVHDQDPTLIYSSGYYAGFDNQNFKYRLSQQLLAAKYYPDLHKQHQQQEYYDRLSSLNDEYYNQYYYEFYKNSLFQQQQQIQQQQYLKRSPSFGELDTNSKYYNTIQIQTDNKSFNNHQDNSKTTDLSQASQPKVEQKVEELNAYQAYEEKPIGGGSNKQKAWFEKDDSPSARNNKFRGKQSKKRQVSENLQEKDGKDGNKKNKSSSVNQNKKEYLKRRTKYDPRKAIEEAKKQKRNQNQEEGEESDKERDDKFQFLKKTTKDIKFQKLEWKVKKKIDCWLTRRPAENSTPKVKSIRFSPIKRERKQKREQMLNHIENTLSGNIPINQYQNSMSSQQILEDEQQAFEEQEYVTFSQKRQVNIVDLERAYKTNYCSKLITMETKLAKLKEQRKLDQSQLNQNSFIPILTNESIFIQNYHPIQFNMVMKELEEQYKMILDFQQMLINY